MIAALTALLFGAGPMPASAAAATTGCEMKLSPASGPVGTVVSITGTTAACDDGGYGGAFGFADEHAGAMIAELPAHGAFSFSYRIPASMPAGDWWAAAQGYAGGGPVAPGPATFLATMGAPLISTFTVTWSPPGWEDFTSIMSTPSHCPPCLGGGGYDAIRAGGFVDTFGGSPNAVGYAGDMHLAAPVVASAFTPDGGGYWMLGADGGVFSYGNARFFGSAADNHLPYPFVGMAPTPDGGGYWLVTRAGGVYAYGDAAFHGQARDLPIRAPVVGIASTADGGGYWIATADGGVYSFGDATFHGSMGGAHLNAPVVAIAPTPDGGGYWLLGADGGVFSFGDAGFHGAALGVSPFPMVGLAPTSDGAGYWLLGADGGVFTYGDAHFAGSGRS